MRGDRQQAPPPTPPKFTVDPARLYEVERNGAVWTDAPEAPGAAEARQRRIRGLWLAAVGANAGAALLAALAFLLGGEAWGAPAGLLAAICLPALLAVLAFDAIARRRLRRRHAARPSDFPGGDA